MAIAPQGTWMNKRELLYAAGGMVAYQLQPDPARADAAWPARPVRIIVPYAPGGTTDIVARRVGARLGESLGQPFVIDNRPGGNTGIGTAAVANAARDGYTLLFTNDATFVANPVMFRGLPYDVQRDLAPVATVTYVPLVLAINEAVPVRSMSELAIYLRDRKDLSYGSFGAGSQAHLMGEMLNRLTGGTMVHIPYKGSAQAVTDVLGNQILLTFPAFPTIRGHVAG